MPEYPLNLKYGEFENIVNSLLKKVIGNDTITFAVGRDGGREATFEGMGNYPSHSEKWTGKWIFQAKFHDINRLGQSKAREILLQEIQDELKKITEKYKIDNYILATNVVLTPYPNRGTLDKIYNEIIPQYKDKIKDYGDVRITIIRNNTKVPLGIP